MAEVKKPPLNMPNLAGVTGAFDKMRHGIETRAEKFMGRIEGVNARADAVFAKGDAKLDVHHEGLKEVDGFLDQLDTALGNGAGGSAESSPTSNDSKD